MGWSSGATLSSSSLRHHPRQQRLWPQLRLRLRLWLRVWLPPRHRHQLPRRRQLHLLPRRLHMRRCRASGWWWWVPWCSSQPPSSFALRRQPRRPLTLAWSTFPRCSRSSSSNKVRPAKTALWWRLRRGNGESRASYSAGCSWPPPPMVDGLCELVRVKWSIQSTLATPHGRLACKRCPKKSVALVLTARVVDRLTPTHQNPMAW